MKNRSLLFAVVIAIASIVVSISLRAQAPATNPTPSPATNPAPAAPAPVAAPVPAPAPAATSGVVKIGDETKRTHGRVTDVDRGDNGCFITFKTEKGAEHIELGKFEICKQKPPLKGKQVVLEYSMETVQAASCYGDPKCKKTETVPLVVAVKIVE